MSECEDSFVEESFADDGNFDQENEQPFQSGVQPPANNLSIIPEEDLQSSITERMQAGRSFEEEESSAFGSSCGFARSFTNLSGQANRIESSFENGGNQLIDEEEKQYFGDPTRDMVLFNAGLMPRNGNGQTSWDMGFTTPRKNDIGKKRVVFQSPENHGSRIHRSGLVEHDDDNKSSPPRNYPNEVMMSPSRPGMAEHDKENLLSPPRFSSTERMPVSMPELASPPKKKLGAMSRLQSKVESSTPIRERTKVPRPHLDLSAIPGLVAPHDVVSFADVDPTIDEAGSMVNKSTIQRAFNGGNTDAKSILELIRNKKDKKAVLSGATSQRQPIERAKEGSQEKEDQLPSVIQTKSSEIAHKRQDDVVRKPVCDLFPRQESEPISRLSSQTSRCSSATGGTTSRTLRPASIVSGVSSTAERESIASYSSKKASANDPIRINRSKVLFGCVNLDEAITDSIRLKSNLNEAQRVSVTLKHNAFKIVNTSCSFMLHANEEVTLPIEFTAKEMSRYKAAAFVKSEKSNAGYTIPIYGAGGTCEIRPVKSEAIRCTSSGYTMITDSLRTIKMKIKNYEERRAFCAVVLMCNGRRIPCEVKPSPYLIIGRNEVQEICLTAHEDFSTLRADSSSGRESSASQFSSVSSSSTKTELSVVLLYGEDLLRQRLIRFIEATPNGREQRQTYEKDQVRFAAEEFTGNWKEDYADEWDISNQDRWAFENFLRKISIGIIPTRRPMVDLDETLKPDNTIMERTFSNMSLVHDVTRSN